MTQTDVTVTWNGADAEISLVGCRTIGDLRDRAIEEFGLTDFESKRLGLFARGGLGLWDDEDAGSVNPGDLLVLRPRVVGV